MATPTSDPLDGPLCPGVLGLHAKKRVSPATMQRVPQIALAAGAVVRPLPVRSMRMGADEGPRQSAVVDNLSSRVFP